jgi:hypothetical protein
MRIVVEDAVKLAATTATYGTTYVNEAEEAAIDAENAAKAAEVADTGVRYPLACAYAAHVAHAAAHAAYAADAAGDGNLEKTAACANACWRSALNALRLVPTERFNRFVAEILGILHHLKSQATDLHLTHNDGVPGLAAYDAFMPTPDAYQALVKSFLNMQPDESLPGNAVTLDASGDSTMSRIVVLEGKTEIAIVRAVLPPEYLEACKFVGMSDRSKLVSVARRLLLRHRVPTAILLATDTLEPSIIADTIRSSRSLMQSAAEDVAFDIIYCVPTIEVIFVESGLDLKRIFPNYENVFSVSLAKNHPRGQFKALLDDGGGPSTLRGFLDSLTLEDCKKVQQAYPIQHLMAFIRNNSDPGSMGSSGQ